MHGRPYSCSYSVLFFLISKFIKTRVYRYWEQIFPGTPVVAKTPLHLPLPSNVHLFSMLTRKGTSLDKSLQISRLGEWFVQYCNKYKTQSNIYCFHSGPEPSWLHTATLVLQKHFCRNRVNYKIENMPLSLGTFRMIWNLWTTGSINGITWYLFPFLELTVHEILVGLTMFCWISRIITGRTFLWHDLNALSVMILYILVLIVSAVIDWERSYVEICVSNLQRIWADSTAKVSQVCRSKQLESCKIGM